MGNEKSRQASATTCKPNDTCVICQEDVADNVSRPDSCPDHFFHHDCLMKWAEHKNTCPLDNRVFQHVVDLKGKKVSVPKRKPNEDEESSEFLRRMLFLLSLLNRRTECSLCGNDSPELERASLACGHRFHRSCIAKLSRFSRQCPQDDCGQDFSEIACEFGEKITFQSLEEDFTCSLCKRIDTDIEIVTSDGCTHRNHRECMEQRCAGGNRTCPQCDSRVRFLRCDLGERVVIDVNDQPAFTCGMCNSQNQSKEAALSTSCGHSFHRECILSVFRTTTNCPVTGCDKPLVTLKCHFGDEFGHSGGEQRSQPTPSNPLYQVLSEVTCDNDFTCSICNERNPEWERAKLPCQCEFHRQCIVNLARQQQHHTCPTCQTTFDSVRCMFGETLTFEDETQKAAKHEEEVPRREEVVAGAVAEVDCSLCQAKVELGSGCRSSSCSHTYHRVCLENIKEAGGNCLVCNKGIPQIIVEEEMGATATPPPQQQPQERLSTPQPIMAEAEEEKPALDSSSKRVCCSCHKVVVAEDMVHSDVCDHLYHLSCLAQAITTGGAQCHLCKQPMKGIVVIDENDDEFTGENCIICAEKIRASEKHQTQCCKNWLHRKCFNLHLEIIRECPVCEIAIPE